MNDDIATLVGISEEATTPEPFSPDGQQWLDKRFKSDEHGYKFWLCRSPVRSFTGCALPDTLTASEKGHVYECAMLMETGSNMVVHRVSGVYKPLPVVQLAKRLRLSDTQCYRFLHKMIDLRIMAREQGRLYINPIYFFRGTYLRPHLYRLFETDLSSVLPQWVVDRFDGIR